MVPELDASLPETRANLVHTGPPGRRGAGVIVGIIDTGIDWRHECFRDGAGNTRVLRIWDQNLTPRPGRCRRAGKLDADADAAVRASLLRLFCLERTNTGTGRLEVHVLSAASDYQSFLLQTGTPIGEADAAANFAFAVG
jgi:hypothetical protein